MHYRAVIKSDVSVSSVHGSKRVNMTLVFALEVAFSKVSFSRPFQLMKINSTESYVFFLARTYRARIRLSFTNTRGIQYSPYLNLCVSPYGVPNLTLGTKYKYINERYCIETCAARY